MACDLDIYIFYGSVLVSLFFIALLKLLYYVLHHYPISISYHYIFVYPHARPIGGMDNGKTKALRNWGRLGRGWDWHGCLGNGFFMFLNHIQFKFNIMIYLKNVCYPALFTYVLSLLPFY